MDNAGDILELIAAAYKDKVSAETMEKLRAEYIALLSAEAECRRSKATTLIMNRHKLEMEKKKFLYSYRKLSSKCGSIPEIEAYINEIDTMIKRVSFEKNHLT